MCIRDSLRTVRSEAVRRGNRFDGRKIGRSGSAGPLEVTKGQLDYEWAHLAKKLRVRAPAWLDGLKGVKGPEANPIFRVVPGGVADWEVAIARPAAKAGKPRGSRVGARRRLPLGDS